MKEGDIVLAYSGSGNSENVLRGVKFANEKSCKTVAFTGIIRGNGGKLAKISSYSLVFNTESMEG